MYIEPNSSQYITMSFCNKNFETFSFKFPTKKNTKHYKAISNYFQFLLFAFSSPPLPIFFLSFLFFVSNLRSRYSAVDPSRQPCEASLLLALSWGGRVLLQEITRARGAVLRPRLRQLMVKKRKEKKKAKTNKATSSQNIQWSGYKLERIAVHFCLNISFFFLRGIIPNLCQDGLLLESQAAINIIWVGVSFEML